MHVIPHDIVNVFIWPASETEPQSVFICRPLAYLPKLPARGKSRNVFARSIKCPLWNLLRWKIQAEKGATDRRKGKRANAGNFSMDRTSERRSTYCDWIDAVTQEGKRGVGKRTWINGNSTSQHEKDLLFLCFYLLFISCRKISSCEPYPCQKRHPRLIILQQRIIRQSSFPSIFLQRCWRSIEPISLVVPLGRLGIRSAPLVKVITSLALHLPWLYSRRL